MSGVEVPRSFHKRVGTLVRHNYAIRFTLLPWLSPVLSPRLYTKAEPREGDNQRRSFTYRKKRIRAVRKVAVAKGLVSAAQHRRRRRPIVLTVHNVTTARDLRPPQATHPRRRTSHQQLARNNFSTLQGLNAQPGVTVTLRVVAGPPPAHLQHIAEQAARSGDLPLDAPGRAAPASHASAQWDELRVWDPGD